MEIFNNAWVVGIGGGILSGLIVTILTRYLFSKKDNSEYMQKVASVNREVVYALRPGISEDHIPDEGVLTALVNSTARKYRVSRNDIYQPKQIAEELIKEIIDSSFISTETKKLYCKTLAHLMTESMPENEAIASEAEKKVAESEYRQNLNEKMSFVLGMTAAIITMLVVFQRFISGVEFSSPIKEVFDLFLPTMTILFATLVTTVSMLIVVRIKRLRKKESGTASDET